ncbi:hypothetical protein PanWU01x14_248340, partial [Parasponia andersonii]
MHHCNQKLHMNYKGGVVAVSYGRLEGISTVHQAELSALRVSLLLAYDRYFSINVAECDFINVVSAINGCYYLSSDGVIVENIVDLLSLIG